MVNIAVMGYGTVGSGVVEVINTNGDIINQRAGDEINIKYVLDIRDFPGDPVQEKIVHDIDVIINDPEVKIVVEVMGGIEPAYTFVKRCLEAGKSVATSNKALVAKHGAELLSIADAMAKGVPCTACHYCTDGCPMRIDIPAIFAAYNTYLVYGNLQGAKNSYKNAVKDKGMASSCVHCLQCEAQCPQKINITERLQEIAKVLED